MRRQLIQAPTVRYAPVGLASAAVGLALTALLTFGMVTSKDGQLEAAIEEQRARVALSPTATDLNDLANLLVVRGDLFEAEEAYRRALELAPDSIEIPYNLALLLQHLEKNKEALQLFSQVVELAPDAAWAHLQIGILSSDLGKRRQAVKAFSKAFALEPRLASPRVNPHLQQRPEVLEAMLKGGRNAKSPQTAPLSFSDPDRIARILIGESAAARAAQRAIERRGLVDEAPAEDPVGATEAEARRRLDVESLPESAQMPRSPRSLRPRDTGPDEPRAEEAELAETGLVAERDDQSEQPQAEEPKRRVVGDDDLRSVRGGVVNSSSRSSVRPGGRSRQPAASAPRPRGRASGGSTSRFRPGARSSARLELRLAPSIPASDAVSSRWQALPVDSARLL